MHQIAMKITEERVRVEVVSIMKLHFLRSNAYFERERWVFKVLFSIKKLTSEDIMFMPREICVKTGLARK